MVERRTTLLGELRAITLGDLLRGDMAVAVVACVAGIYAAAEQPSVIARVIPVLASFIGVVIGAVIAGLALMAAFMDQKFLRTLTLIDESPLRPMRPFLFTTVLGIAASFFTVVLSAIESGTASPWITAPIAGFAFGTAAWTLASVIPALDVLVQFVHVQQDAAEIDEQSLTGLLAEKNRRDKEAG